MAPRFVDVPDMVIWSQCIGGFIINFGLTEFLTFRCVQVHSGDAAALALRKKKLAERIHAAKKSISASRLSPQQKRRAKELWDEISFLSQRRNRIAHNPLLGGTNSTSGALVFSVVDLRRMTPSGPNAQEALNPAQIEADALRVGAINRELSALIESPPSG